MAKNSKTAERKIYLEWAKTLQLDFFQECRKIRAKRKRALKIALKIVKDKLVYNRLNI